MVVVEVLLVVLLLRLVGVATRVYIPFANVGGRGSKDLTASGLQYWGRARAALAHSKSAWIQHRVNGRSPDRVQRAAPSTRPGISCPIHAARHNYGGVDDG